MWKRAAIVLGALLLAQHAMAGPDADTLKSGIERKLMVVEARAALSQHELLALRNRFNTVITQAHNSNASKTNPSLVGQLQDIDRRLDEANQKSLAAVMFKFF